MRRTYLVCYDVSEPKRLQRVHAKMLGYGEPAQYSVFLCDLSRKELALLKADLSGQMDLVADRLMVVDMGADGMDRVEFVGARMERHRREPALII